MTLHAAGEAGSGSGNEGGTPPPAPGRVFFSYARSDAEFVLKIARTLRVDGVELWVDQLDIPKGARWDESVEGALKGCSCLVVVLSPASVNSFNVLDEVYYTLGEGKRVVPILLHPCEIPFRLKRIQYIDFTAGYQQGYEELLATLTQRSARERQAPPPPPEPVIEPVAPGAQGPPAASRGRTLRHMAQGGALMFFTLLIVGLVSETGKDRQLSEQAQAVSPLAEAAPADAETGPGAPTGTGAADGAPTAAVWPPGSAASPALPPESGEAATTHASPEQAAPEPAPPPAPPAPPPIDAARLSLFVASFIGAHNRRDLGQILALYADEVDYLGAGLGPQAVASDKEFMYGKWTDMQFRLGSKIDYALSDDGQGATLAFTVDFSASNAETENRGRVREVMELRMVDGAPKIVSERHTVPP